MKRGESHVTGQPATEVGRARQPAKMVGKRKEARGVRTGEVGTVPSAKNPYTLVRGDWRIGSTRRIPQKVHSLMDLVALTASTGRLTWLRRFLLWHLGSVSLRESRVRETCMHGLSGGRWPASGQPDAPPPTRLNYSKHSLLAILG